MSIRRRNSFGSQFRCPETLESRQLLAGHGFSAFSHLASSASTAQQASYISSAFAGSRSAAQDGIFAALGARSHGAAAHGTTLSATLTDANSAATGTVTYKTYVEDGVTETKLKVNITGAEADSTLQVTVAGVVVGQVAANASGNASLVLSSDPEGDEQALPDNFPTAVAAGDAVSAGTLMGTLATVTRGHRDSSTTTLSASLTDETTGAAGTVTYKMSTENGETSLKVSVTGAEANSALGVTIGDVNVGEITTDANGAGSIVLSSDPTGDEKALPDNFPTSITAGTAVGIGTMTGALVVVNRGGGHHGCHGEAAALNATLSDSTTGAAATVSYRTSASSTNLSVRVTGAAADSSPDVSIGGTVVGQVNTDATGAGKLVLASNPTSNQQPLPANFPTTIVAGTTINVGTMTGSFGATASRRGFRSFRGR